MENTTGDLHGSVNTGDVFTDFLSGLADSMGVAMPETLSALSASMSRDMRMAPGKVLLLVPQVHILTPSGIRKGVKVMEEEQKAMMDRPLLVLVSGADSVRAGEMVWLDFNSLQGAPARMVGGIRTVVVDEYSIYAWVTGEKLGTEHAWLETHAKEGRDASANDLELQNKQPKTLFVGNNIN